MFKNKISYLLNEVLQSHSTLSIHFICKFNLTLKSFELVKDKDYSATIIVLLLLSVRAKLTISVSYCRRLLTFPHRL